MTQRKLGCAPGNSIGTAPYLLTANCCTEDAFYVANGYKRTEEGISLVLFTPTLPLFMLFAAAAPPQRIDSTPVTQAQSQLHVPDAIAPAVLHYLACLYAVRGLPFLLGRDGSRISYQTSNGNCSAERMRAVDGALKLLADKPVPGGASPTAFVEQALVEVESFVSSLPLRRSDESANQPPIGLPIMIEDEVKPAYNHYEECLKTQVSYSSLTLETILAAFKDAMKVCWSVRESSVAEAQGALVKKGWDSAASAKAAENTFVAADQSWLEMGKQFHDSLVSRRGGQRHP